jgi:hypothetical protein
LEVQEGMRFGNDGSLGTPKLPLEHYRFGCNLASPGILPRNQLQFGFVH